MPEVFSLAVIKPHDGMREECLRVLRDLYALLGRKHYSRDLLYEDARDHRRLINFRYWSSEEAREEAHEDPDVHRLWAELGRLCEVEQVYERLEEVPQG